MLPVPKYETSPTGKVNDFLNQQKKKKKKSSL